MFFFKVVFLAATLSYVQQLTVVVQIFTMEMFFNKWFKTVLRFSAKLFDSQITIQYTKHQSRSENLRWNSSYKLLDKMWESCRTVSSTTFMLAYVPNLSWKYLPWKALELKQIWNLEFSTAVFSEKECAIKFFLQKCFSFSWLHQNINKDWEEW